MVQQNLILFSFAKFGLTHLDNMRRDTELRVSDKSARQRLGKVSNIELRYNHVIETNKLRILLMEYMAGGRMSHYRLSWIGGTHQ